MERERTMKREGSRKLRAQVPRTLRTVMFCLHAEVFLGVCYGIVTYKVPSRVGQQLIAFAPPSLEVVV